VARRPEALAALRRFTWHVGGVTTAITLLMLAPPLLNLYLGGVIHLPQPLRTYVQVGTAVGVLIPLLTALGSWARGLLVAMGQTGAAYRGMGINITTHAGVLIAGILLHAPGMWVAAAAFTAAAAAEYLYLRRSAAALRYAVVTAQHEEVDSARR
jgi:hypothetical protein